MINFNKKVAVILPLHNEEKFIGKALNSLKNQTYPNSLIEIIVVNNNSTDKSTEIVKNYNVRLINETQGPVGRVRNVGAFQSDAEILFFLDSDCLAPPDWIEKGVDFVEKNEGKVAAGGLRLNESPKFLERYWLLTSKHGEMLPSELLGSCLIISKTIFEQVGGFDESITAGEDSALHQSLVKEKFSVHIAREFSVVHLGNAVTVNAFLKRQIWHSENYFKNLSRSIRDLVFLTVCVFIVSTVGFFITFPASQSMIFFAFILGCVFLRSFKRIYSSKNYSHLKTIPQILVLDFLYLIGRSMGLIKGLCKNLVNKLI